MIIKSKQISTSWVCEYKGLSYVRIIYEYPEQGYLKGLVHWKSNFDESKTLPSLIASREELEAAFLAKQREDKIDNVLD